MANKSFIEQGNQTKDWVDVLKDTTGKAVDKVNVATLAFVEDGVEEYEKYDIRTVSPFPLEQGQKPYTIRAYCKQGESFNKGDIVLVVFTNKNFKNNLEYKEPMESSNDETHPITCGVIIYTLSKGE